VGNIALGKGGKERQKKENIVGKKCRRDLFSMLYGNFSGIGEMQRLERIFWLKGVPQVGGRIAPSLFGTAKKTLNPSALKT